MDRTERIRQYIVESFLFEDDSRLTNATSFQESGIIDSTGMLDLASFLERTFEIRIEDAEFVPGNLDSIENIVAFVQKKRGD